jgi:catechol 2,3-dioxygenase-like lactoylglutathione lyase family enzyme
MRHAALGVSDLARSLGFYLDTLGFEPAYVTDSDWAMVSMAGTTLSLIPVPGYTPPRILGGAHPAHLGIVLASPAEVDALHARLQYTDVTAIEAPKAHRDGSYGFYLADPDGNALECIFIPFRLQGAANPGPCADAVILVADGSPEARWAEPYHDLVARMQRHAADMPIGLAFLATAHPGVREVAMLLAAQGDVRRIHVVPVTVAFGDGYGHELSALVAAAREACPDVTFTVAGAIGAHAEVQEAMVSAIVAMVAGAS